MKNMDLANYIINKSIELKYPVSNVKLQRVLYFMNLYYFSLNSKFLLEGEPFQAAHIGPLIPEVYQEYACFGGLSISRKVNKVKNSIFKDVEFQEVDLNTEKFNKFLLYLISMDSWTLENYSKRVDGAWNKTYNKDNPKIIIKNELIIKEAIINNKKDNKELNSKDEENSLNEEQLNLIDKYE